MSPRLARWLMATAIMLASPPHPGGRVVAALLGHASLNSTHVYLGLEVPDLARMVERSQPRATARGGDDAV